MSSTSLDTRFRSDTTTSGTAKIQRVYDSLAAFYPASSNLFHATAHQEALAASGIQDGMRVLEVASGSGEMFRRITLLNPAGLNIGLDLSSNMASQTQARIRKEFPHQKSFCQAADARHLPFADETFDSVVCCYLLELIAEEDLHCTLEGFHRVLRPGGRLVLTLIGQNSNLFNAAYKVCGGLVPAFWGKQVEQKAAAAVRCGFQILYDQRVRQLFYPSRVIVASRERDQRT